MLIDPDLRSELKVINLCSVLLKTDYRQKGCKKYYRAGSDTNLRGQVFSKILKKTQIILIFLTPLKQIPVNMYFYILRYKKYLLLSKKDIRCGYV